MADFQFPPGGSGVKVTAPNGVTYYWDVDNNRWGIASTGTTFSGVVKVSSSAPNGIEGDLWYNTSDPLHHDLYINVSSAWEQAAPGKQEHVDLIERVSILEDTSERVSQYQCHEAHTAMGDLPPQGKFSSAGTSIKYVNKFRLHRIDAFQNPLPILHDGDGLEMLHSENGHSFRFTITSAYEGPEGDLDQVIEVKYLGGHNDSVKIGDHYIFKFHTPSSDIELIAHLEKDQTFTGINTFDGDVVFTGNVTLPDGDGDGTGDDVPTLDGDNTFTGNNIFAKTTFKSDDDTHRLYMKDSSGNTNLTIFPTGNISSKGRIDFTAKGNDTFANLFSSKIKVTPADGWDSNTHGEFGLYVDISNKNTWKNRFVVGGRGSREKAFEVYDDGEGRAKVYGSFTADNRIVAGGDVTANGDVDIRSSLGEDDTLSATEVGKVYMITNVDLSVNQAAVTWARAGAMNINAGSIFTCTSNETLPTGNTVQEFLGTNHLNVVGDISAGGEISGDDIEGHTFLFSGDGALQGNTSIQDATLEGTMTVNGSIDISNSSISNIGPVPKSWFRKVLKEFNDEYRSIYINEGTNGSSDPAIEIKASGSNSNIKIKTSGGATGWGVNVGSSLMYGGTSSNPWMPTSDQHFTTKKYVDDSTAGYNNIAKGLPFNYTNVPTDAKNGKFTAKLENNVLSMYIAKSTIDGIEWYDAGMVLMNLDWGVVNGGGALYTIRRASDNQITRQGIITSFQYLADHCKLIVHNGAINTGSMTVGNLHYITIGGLF